MDIEFLKSKFRHKAEADIKDIRIAIKATPFLVKEVIRLEEELELKNNMIEKLKKKIKHQPPLVQKGKKDKFSWIVKVNEETNTILFQFYGTPDKSGAKICSNVIINMTENLEPGFSVISDLRKLNIEFMSKRLGFYLRKVHYIFSGMDIKYLIRVVEDSKDLEVIMEHCNDNVNFKMFSVTSIEEAKNVIRNFGKYLKE
ncbi:MAG: hypothetical protein RBR53_00870 [Desulforegulaceae bacterium]|nr:hypothetical protein [Desulforegulaceae bacterium]